MLHREMAAEEDEAVLRVVGDEPREGRALRLQVPDRPTRDVPPLPEPVDHAVLELGLEVLGVAEAVRGGNVVPGLVAKAALPPPVQRLLLGVLLLDPLGGVGDRALALENVDGGTPRAPARR